MVLGRIGLYLLGNIGIPARFKTLRFQVCTWLVVLERYKVWVAQIRLRVAPRCLVWAFPNARAMRGRG